MDLTALASRQTTRRGFLKLGSAAGLGLASVGAFGSVVRGASFVAPGAIILANSKGLILQDPTRCVGCRRCETACMEYNDGKSQPSLARVKVGRNYNFGPEGAREGSGRGDGEFGNFRLIQETCKQCPHPVPCATACPHGAIVADPGTGARIVDQEKCVGCQICEGACPWQMIKVDSDNMKATKCFLCQECAIECPTGALTYVPWADHTKDTPPRVSAMKLVSTQVTQDCAPCHTRR